jgi:uncharacterized membrane protein YphA (DoxX/SURF4 family)
MKSNTDLALLLVRVGLALVFLAHGWEKISGMEYTIQYFASLNLSPVLAYLVAYTEFIGGLLMLVGFGTGWAGVALAATMVGSIVMVKLGKGFVGGYEFDLMLFLSAISISLAGAGDYTLKYLFRKG